MCYNLGINSRNSCSYEEAKTEILALKKKLVELLTQTATGAQQSGKLPSVSLPEVYLEHPQNPEHGDYASSFPLKLARATGSNPMAIAEELIGLMASMPEIDSIVAAPPGFINFTLKNSWLTSQVESILRSGDAYGNIDLGQVNHIAAEIPFRRHLRILVQALLIADVK